MGPEGPKWGREVLFPTNPDLADILGRTDFDFENCYFFDFFGSRIPRFPGSQISKIPEIWLGPGLGPGWGPGLGPDAAGAAGAGRILRSQPDPSPNAPRDQIRRKGPCCDLMEHQRSELTKNHELGIVGNLREFG